MLYTVKKHSFIVEYVLQCFVGLIHVLKAKLSTHGCFLMPWLLFDALCGFILAIFIPSCFATIPITVGCIPVHCHPHAV